jgi:hypothetical protein|mmetsp:Transcript_56191/g.93380  ORF Transcript_56191/g.93380 Transcript_56191/m.93380 type:complete len:228 (-) Transcript_56191:1837-2520(-)
MSPSVDPSAQAPQTPPASVFSTHWRLHFTSGRGPRTLGVSPRHTSPWIFHRSVQGGRVAVCPVLGHYDFSLNEGWSGDASPPFSPLVLNPPWSPVLGMHEHARQAGGGSVPRAHPVSHQNGAVKGDISCSCRGLPRSSHWTATPHTRIHLKGRAANGFNQHIFLLFWEHPSPAAHFSGAFPIVVVDTVSNAQSFLLHDNQITCAVCEYTPPQPNCLTHASLPLSHII